MSLSKPLYPLLSTGSPSKTRPNMSETLLTGMLRIKTNKPTNKDGNIRMIQFEAVHES